MPTVYTEEQRIRRRETHRKWRLANPNYHANLESPEERKARQNSYYPRRAEKQREYYRNRRRTQREETLAKDQQHRDKNSAKLLAYFRNYRLTRGDDLKEYQKRYRRDNVAKLKANYLVWYERNRARIIRQTTAYGKLWKRANPHKARQMYQRRRIAVRAATIEDCSEKIKELLQVANCNWCDCPLNSDNREIDHVVPISRGGFHRKSNLVAACGRCNRSKGAKLLHEWKPNEYKEAA